MESSRAKNSRNQVCCLGKNKLALAIRGNLSFRFEHAQTCFIDIRKMYDRHSKSCEKILFELRIVVSAQQEYRQ